MSSTKDTYQRGYLFLSAFIASKAKKQDPEVKAQNEFIHSTHKEDRDRETVLKQTSASPPVKMKEKDTFSYMVT